VRHFLTLLAIFEMMASSPAFAAWSIFKDPGQNFTFEAPTKVTVTNSQSVSHSGMVIPSITYTSDEGLIAMGVIDGEMVADPAISMVFTPQQIMDQDVAGIPQAYGGKVSSVQTELLDGQVGRRVEMEGPDNTVYTFRIFVLKDHLYTAFSGYRPGASDKLKADAVRFHKSFHLSSAP